MWRVFVFLISRVRLGCIVLRIFDDALIWLIKWPYLPQIGVCGRAVNTCNSGSWGAGFKSRSFLTPLCLSSPRCIDGCDGLESRPGGSSNTPRHGSCYGNRDKLRPCGPLARVRLYLYYLPQIPVIWTKASLVISGMNITTIPYQQGETRLISNRWHPAGIRFLKNPTLLLLRNDRKSRPLY